MLQRPYLALDLASAYPTGHAKRPVPPRIIENVASNGSRKGRSVDVKPSGCLASPRSQSAGSRPKGSPLGGRHRQEFFNVASQNKAPAQSQHRRKAPLGDGADLRLHCLHFHAAHPWHHLQLLLQQVQAGGGRADVRSRSSPRRRASMQHRARYASAKSSPPTSIAQQLRSPAIPEAEARLAHGHLRAARRQHRRPSRRAVLPLPGGRDHRLRRRHGHQHLGRCQPAALRL